MSTRGRVRAPELVGRGGWINTGGKSLSLRGDLRGRIVLLDFWTYCCVNCLHVLDELRPLEDKYRDVLVVIGVHSPKFVHEAQHASVLDAVRRYDVEHPVLDDPDLTTWSQYAVRAWPTLVLVDPDGYVAAQFSGEGHAHALDRIIGGLVEEYDATGSLRRGDQPYVAPPPMAGEFAFPSKVTLMRNGSLVISDTGHHQLVVDFVDGSARIGDGMRGRVDGSFETARFAEPGGVVELPAEVAIAVGYDLVVADTVNHCLRGVSLSNRTVETIAGTGRQWMQGEEAAGPATDISLSSPWDVEWYDGQVIVASAGVHRLDAFDPVGATVQTWAGTTSEGLVDGDLPNAWFAQPSGLVTSRDGHTLWVVDAETSALRRVRNSVVTTEIGAGLFDFGHIDGPAAAARLQHPLGVALLPDGSVVIADTYNGAIRRFDPVTLVVTTLAAGLSEPSDLAIDDTRGSLLVVESSGHRLTRVGIPAEASSVASGSYRVVREPLSVAHGRVHLEVVFDPPPGEILDGRYGAATHLVVSATPHELLVAGNGPGSDLQRELVIADSVDEGVLHVSVRAASCDDPDSLGAPEHPACHIHQQDWGIPVSVRSMGERQLRLVLSGS